MINVKQMRCHTTVEMRAKESNGQWQQAIDEAVWNLAILKMSLVWNFALNVALQILSY